MVSLVAYGGGTDSTGMLIRMCLSDEPAPDLILFADTGGEKPDTYAFVTLFSDWLARQGWPRIEIVRVESTTLEADCLTRKALPGVAYGNKSCSQRYKAEPQDKLANNHPACRAAWDRGEKVTKIIGYDVDEQKRISNSLAKALTDPKYILRFPLNEWKWSREDCERAITEVQLPLPGKSACFFCPMSKPADVRRLQRQHPDLLQRALDMEANANLNSLAGLGRRWSWRQLIDQGTMFPEAYDREASAMPCECFD